MAKNTLAASLLLLVTFPLLAQQERELLRNVGMGQAQRLEEYNSVFLQQELYFASRHRIVRADINVLLQERDIAITPFQDVEPIRIVYEALERLGDDAVFWKGHVMFPEDDQLFKQSGIGIPGNISMFAWDQDQDGNAHNSAENRFEFPPEWTFDESGNLITDGAVISGNTPPQTPERIERHMWLKGLEKHAFYSANAVLEVPGGSRYILKPLPYTPRYSVIYEISPGTTIPVRVDGVPGERDTRTETEKELFRQYRTFLQSLPKEEGKAVRGDIQ